MKAGIVRPLDGSAGAGEAAPEPPEAPIVGSLPPDDPLVTCLVFLCRYHGRPRSAQVLLSGLPISGRRLTPELFVRAAERAGLVARAVRRRLERIHPWTLPAVLLLDDGDAAVLVERRPDGSCLVIPGSGGGGETLVPAAELAARYGGYALLARPEHRFAATGGAERDVPRPRAWFWGTLMENWWTYIQVGLASIVINCFALANSLFTMNVYDRVLPNNAVETGVALAIGAASVFLFDFLLRNLRAWFIDFVGRRADVILACRIFDQVLDMKIAYRPASAGSFAAIVREFETVRDFFTSATLSTFVDLPFAFLFVGVIALISPPIGLLLLGVVLVVLLWGAVIQIPIARATSRNQKQGEHKHGILIESLTGLETLKMVGAEGRMRRIWEELVGNTAALGQKSRLYSNLGVHFVQMAQQMTMVGTVLAGIFLVGEGRLSAGGLIACVILSGRATGPMAQVAQLAMRFHQARSSLRALDRIMRLPVERPPGAQLLNRPHLSGALAFEGVSFVYPASSSEVLRDVSFKIAAGEKVGIVGRIGSGKSTIAKLAGGLYEPGKGSVRLDGTDVRQIEPSDVRANVGFVPQELFLFRGTIRENIAIAAPAASDLDVVAVAEAVGLHDFVAQHPAGYDLQVGERGDGLSGGQRQAVALARALLKGPNLLILDEPTSSMDTRSEEQIVASLGRLLQDRTILLITHRLSLLKLVDRLIVLDRGRIVADGPREEVLARLSSGRIATG
ncbi:ATP-binding cassette, subfamily C, LapB [Tistlia consotensis]|uniref:ATP-binding cassette, subfamily C, LapB n=1 Tax=Tistlia consotensis USBA 355 TaxID=560819 RepID=A0A1Y6BA22_9PROT|nr:type I secretion system permease/ATPase [Tistlia consotensis]SME92801.1 ATP-binding cassette, subfamily C, LapB [Tistlia consotensis USBA 355]SNR28254.1 ATP-binding cassette, subfamily C, LapB [Tistlia consotensis]